ncbi:MAG: class I tRNA ligase family protein [Candidatus Woesebacteria bacterium]|nr:class I tRNA ligase family protein [Candidatus Woesebacteria bacterium]
MKYNPAEVEHKWQGIWEKEGIYHAQDFSDKKKFYLLVEFPYPSGAGLHIGHVRSWGAMDSYARKKRMEGFNVLYPMGWDAFGLPAENYAIKTGTHPSKVVPENIKVFKRQCQALGLSFDWTREIDTTDPKYYKWTQWIFLQLFKKGLAYQAEVLVNWCPKCKTNLADEEVLPNGTHERCGMPIERRLQKQWLLRITKYAERLLDDLKTVDFAPQIARQQVNWIGKSAGMKIKFGDVKVFTTRPDTLNAVTFLATSKLYEEGSKEKIGKFSGKYAINPLDGRKIPIWDTNYVTPDYGTGTIMGVPAHDERDMDFAKKYHLDIIQKDPDEKLWQVIEKNGWGEKYTNYHLRDWIFSRQHYWGEPIPIIHCPKCGPVAVPEKDLPVELPYLEKYEPSGTGESPLAKVKDWLEVPCPQCGEPGRRETDTMPNWAGSNWYFIRYADPNNNNEIASKKKMDYWLPVDLYQGGFEHTTLHLLYSRFIYKFLFDIGIVPNSEPYLKRYSHGIVLGADGRKMSKSFDNVISPDQIVGKYGADTLRIYEMFMGPFDQMVAWSEESLEGCYRFLGRVWRAFESRVGNDKPSLILLTKLHQTINKVDRDIEAFKFNTIVSSLMEFVNTWEEEGSIDKESANLFVRLLAPFTPHLAEEIWHEVLGNAESIHMSTWPEYDPKYLQVGEVVMVIQVNGKLRSQLTVNSEQSTVKEEMEKLAKNDAKVAKWLDGQKIKKVIFVSGKIINFVVQK